jgi:hypothetical protein
MKRLLDVYTPGVKRIAVATGLHDQDGFKPQSQGMQAGGGYSKSIEGMASQKLSAATKGKLRAAGHTNGAAHNHLPFYFHKDLIEALGKLGGSESLGTPRV